MKNFPKSFFVNGMHCGISKKKNKKDLGVIISEIPCIASGVFTKSLTKAAPVLISQKNIKSKNIKAVLVNSGCANACTGNRGLNDAKKSVDMFAENLSCKSNEILLASTGVIGSFLPMKNMESGINEISFDTVNFNDKNIKNFTEAIMTTDTFPKVSSRSFKLDGKKINIWGTCKGAGMIHPNMATMLAFILTDIKIKKKLLDKALKNIVQATFNAISVDGDTSTNDSVFVLANSSSGNNILKSENKNYKIFYENLLYVMRDLAKMIVKDGEGATKFISIKIKNCKTKSDAYKIGKTIATSPLVKTAFFGGDPNWGRIVAAAGRSGVKFNPDKIKLYFNNIKIFENGIGIEKNYKIFEKEFQKKESEIILDINQGKEEGTTYTCDLSYDYVKINGSYMT
jgi:glutamate N-acetyltransferase / amino-acid N-acetyltransferase